MNSDVSLYWVQEALYTAVLVAGPLLGVALLVGLGVALFQAVTSMQEMTISFIPKLIAMVLVLLVLASWMMQMLTDFTTAAFTFISSVSQ
ncbi:MAG: flagellar biosynthesis protein FliQ [Bacteroidetes bacterium]|jgi:flagellar biosynthetic protein FliQ|nr:flagellar biosynthesis protein FliQ [Bacteroidota bacterium]